jgi:hypothetical protein
MDVGDGLFGPHQLGGQRGQPRTRLPGTLDLLARVEEPGRWVLGGRPGPCIRTAPPPRCCCVFPRRLDLAVSFLPDCA